MRVRQRLLAAIVSLWAVVGGGRLAPAEDLSAQAVVDAIERGKRLLLREQDASGGWNSQLPDGYSYRIGVTALNVLTLLNCGMSPQDQAVKRGLSFLRSVPMSPTLRTYEISLMVMALAAAKDRADLPRIHAWARWLEEAQITNEATNPGAWTYSQRGGQSDLGGDPSNTQFAILGLREAAEAGVQVNRLVWERSRGYWERLQNPDGGWGYGKDSPSSGSMTVAGVASLAIIEQMLRTDEGVAADGTPPCCRAEPPNETLERGLRWIASRFTVGQNPGARSWLLYYTYGIERAGRLTGRRFFGDHDWYREGAAYLILTQNHAGWWKGVGAVEENSPTVATSLALLFLSKGLAPVMMSKLKHGPRDPTRPLEVVGTDWNRHPRDVRNLMEHISGLPRWPALLTSQEVDLLKAAKQAAGIDTLLQSPMLFLTGSQPLQFAPEEKTMLKEYLLQGGFVFACPSCQSADFEASLRELLVEILPPGEGELKPLAADHPVYRSEHLLPQESVPLFGVDVGCRTSVIYSPEDLACLWSYWQRHDPPKRNPQLKAKVIRANQIAVNVAAYATGREPPRSLEAPRKLAENGELDNIERGLLQIAKLRHTGNWDAAPRALRNLLLALNDTVGVAASTKPRDVAASDPSLFQYPLLYMHGRTRFQLNAEEREKLKLHLSRGGVLFADACCGSRPFDTSFRDLVKQLYPDKPFARIPVEHEMFTEKVGRDVSRLRRRTSEGAGGGVIGATVREVEPFLEGIEDDGRYVIIYSKYDISCALERQSTLNCEGYLPEDAVKLATNVVLYSLLQDVRLNVGAPDK